MNEYTCKSCKKELSRIGITSYCTQTYHMEDDSYTNTEVGETVSGFCIECGAEISNKDLKKLGIPIPTP